MKLIVTFGGTNPQLEFDGTATEVESPTTKAVINAWVAMQTVNASEAAKELLRVADTMNAASASIEGAKKTLDTTGQ